MTPGREGKHSTLAVGSRWEDIALAHLTNNGLQLVLRNFRCRMGEIDLVMQDAKHLVFVEVRYRKKNRFASAAESVDVHKQRKLAFAAATFLSRNSKFRNRIVRFDVVAFDAGPDDQCKLQWLVDAFRPED